jgi:predicted ferric reductase
MTQARRTAWRAASPLEQCRALIGVAASLPLALAAAFGVPPRLGLGWDWAMAIGAIGMGVLAALPVLTARFWSWLLADVAAARFAHCLHRHLGYAVLGLLGAHVAAVLVVEPITLEYLKLSAPWPMLSAIAATVLVALLVMSSPGHDAERIGYQRWRRWHAVGSVLAVVLAAHHLIGAGHYFTRDLRALAVVVAAVTPTALSVAYPYLGARAGRIGLAKPMPAASRLDVAAARTLSVQATLVMLVAWCALALAFAAA